MELQGIVHLDPDYLIERIDNEIVAYHPTRTVSLYLNDTGALIWELCDGHRSIADIIAILSDQYPESSEQIEHDVKDIIRRLLDHDMAELKIPRLSP
jgi:hypothetical protein